MYKYLSFSYFDDHNYVYFPSSGGTSYIEEDDLKLDLGNLDNNDVSINKSNW